jgi:hypothetical protein
MLSAEWTLLNDPERLRQLASQFLTLQTVSPNQFTSLAELDSRLPAPVPPGTPGNGGTAAPSADVAVPVAADDAGRTGADEGRPGEAKPAEARVADAAPSATPKPAAPQAATPTPAAALPSPVRVATTMPPEQSRSIESKPPELAHPIESKPPAPRFAIATQPHPAAIQPRLPERGPGPVIAETRPMAPPRVPASPPPRQFAPQPTGSFLGMAHDMAAPPPPLPRPMPVSAPNWSYSNGG